MNPEKQGAADADAPSSAAATSAASPPPPEAPDLAPAEPSDVAAEAPPAASAAKAPELSPAACGARLAELFPALFVAPGAPGPAKPIKLRIHADIRLRAPGVFSKRTLGIFFNRYTTTNAYLKALASAAHRFDLDGEPAGDIADEHRQAATEELARRHALAAERRAAQRPPSHQEAPASGAEPVPGERREPRSEGPRGPRQDTRAEERFARPPRPSRPPQAPRGRDGPGRPERAAGARPPRGGEPPTPQHRPERAPPARDLAPAATVLPADPAQRERAMLLRNFEASPLSKANFCALKGMTEAALDAALEQALAERHGHGR